MSPIRFALSLVCLSAVVLSSNIPAIAQDAETQDAKPTVASDDSWCATLQFGVALAARTTRSFHGVVKAIDNKTNVIKVDVDYQISLDGKTIKVQNKVVEVVLTSRTVLQKINVIRVTSTEGKTTVKIQMRPLPRAAIKAGQSLTFSFISPLNSASDERDNRVVETPVRVEVVAVFVRELAPPKAE